MTFFAAPFWKVMGRMAAGTVVVTSVGLSTLAFTGGVISGVASAIYKDKKKTGEKMEEVGEKIKEAGKKLQEVT